ncbi:MAG TPA: hypothetical protein VGC41_02130 [Kofleriaceae bacterium]
MDVDEDELAAHVASVTDDPASALVLADWLQEHQHPWGELIALQVRQDPAFQERADALLAEHAAEVCPILARAGVTATWKNGFVDRIQITCVPEDLYEALLDLRDTPATSRLDQIVLAPVQESFETWRDVDDSVERVADPWDSLARYAEEIPARVTKLGFGPWPASAAAAYTHMPSFTQISSAFPATTELALAGFPPNGALGMLALDHLRALEIRFATAEDHHLAAIARQSFPVLERLEVGTGGQIYATVDEVHEPSFEDDHYVYPPFSASDLEAMVGYDHEPLSEVTAAGIASLLEGTYPKLEHLGLAHGILDAAKLAPILASPLLAQLRTLDLSNCALDDSCVDALVAARTPLNRLKRLELSGNRFSEQGVSKLRAALSKAKLAGAPAPRFLFRYVSTVE